MGETGGSELARPALIAAAPPSAASRRRGIVLDRYFTGVAILPTFLVMLGVFGIPLAFSFYLSFTGYAQGQGLFSGGYVGLENYQDLLSINRYYPDQAFYKYGNGFLSARGTRHSNTFVPQPAGSGPPSVPRG